MTKTRFFTTRRGMIAAAATFALCGQALAQSASPIKILYQGPITGGSTSMGAAGRDGAVMAVDEINRSGGVLGRQIELIIRDDKANNAEGIKIAKEALQIGVAGVVGIANTGVAMANNRYFQDGYIPTIISMATGSLVTRQFADQPNNYIFRNVAHDAIQAPLIVREATQRLGVKKPAIIADTTGYGQAGRADYESSMALAGINPAFIGSMKVGDTDVTEQLEKARAAGADAVLAFCIGPEVGAIANTMKKMNWNVPLLAPWTMSMASFIEAAGNNGNGGRMPQTFVVDSELPKRKAFVEAYMKKFNPPSGRISSPSSAAQTYDAMFLMAAAIKQAGSTEGPKVRAALENLNTTVEGVVQAYSRPWTRRDREAFTSNQVVFGEWKNGKVSYANPSDAKLGYVAKVTDDPIDLFKR